MSGGAEQAGTGTSSVSFVWNDQPAAREKLSCLFELLGVAIFSQKIGDFDVAVSRVMEVSKQITKFKLRALTDTPVTALEGDSEFQEILKAYNGNTLKTCANTLVQGKLLATGSNSSWHMRAWFGLAWFVLDVFSSKLVSCRISTKVQRG